MLRKSAPRLHNFIVVLPLKISTCCILSVGNAVPLSPCPPDRGSPLLIWFIISLNKLTILFLHFRIEMIKIESRGRSKFAVGMRDSVPETYFPPQVHQDEADTGEQLISSILISASQQCAGVLMGCAQDHRLKIFRLSLN
jgi:hypothetical protein